jgi:MFS family permease
MVKIDRRGAGSGAARLISDIERSTMRRVTRRIIPVLVFGYLLAYLDRVNLSFAALKMNTDLHLSSTDFGFAAGLFFVTYCLLELPSNLTLNALGARKWLSRIMLTWGIIAIGAAFVTGPKSFYAERLLLGAAEAGFYPGILFYLTLWFPARYRARMVGYFLTAIPLGGIFGGPAASYLLSLHGLGLAGWQWLFIAEGLPPVILAPVLWVYLQDRPAEANWLTPAEKAWLAAELAHDTPPSIARGALRELAALADSRVALLALLYFSNVSLVTGITFFLPQIIKGFGLGIGEVGYVAAIPSIVALAGIIYWGHRSDAKNERYGHTAVANALAGISLIAAMALHDPVWRIAAISVSLAATIATTVPFWAIPGTFLSGAGAAGGIGAISALGIFAGFIGPSFIGFMKDLTGDYRAGFEVLAAFAVVMSGVFFLAGKRQGRAIVRAGDLTAKV